MKPVKGKKTEKRDHPMTIKFTATERKAVAAKAKAADVCDTDYVRSLAVGTPLSQAPVALTLERVLIARSLGALNEAGSLLRDIKDVMVVGDTPLAQSVDTALSKVQMGAEAAMKALGAE
jgi:hypothetical protein